MKADRAVDIAESLKVVTIGRAMTLGAYHAFWSDSDNELDDEMVQCVGKMDKNGVVRIRWKLNGWPSTYAAVVSFLRSRPSTTTTIERGV